MQQAAVPTLRRSVAKACRILAFYGIAEDVVGQVSARAGPSALLVRCRGNAERGLLYTTADDVHLVSLDGPHLLTEGMRCRASFPSTPRRCGTGGMSRPSCTPTRQP